jgi:hypothetical protein
MKLIRAAVMAIAAMALVGCSEVSTQYPVGSTTGLVPDPALAGTWLVRAEKTNDVERTADGKVAAYVHVLPAKDGGFDIVVAALPKKFDEKGEYQFYRATTGRAGENRFLNIVMLSPPGEQPRTAPTHGTIPVLYRFEVNGDLAIFELDDDKAVAAIRAGAIAGTIKKNTYKFDGKEYEGTTDITITAQPPALDAFMAKPEAIALVKQIGLLKRAD